MIPNCSKHRHQTGYDELQHPWRLPPTWKENSCPPQLVLPNISDPLILPEQFSVHSAAAWAFSKPNDSTHHGLVLKKLPHPSTPASQKIYYTQAHAMEETRGCCSQNIKQINWLPSNTPFFFPSHKMTQATEKLIQLSADWEKRVWSSVGLSYGAQLG